VNARIGYPPAAVVWHTLEAIRSADVGTAGAQRAGDRWHRKRWTMTSALSCYYLDEPLAADELLFVQQCLLGPWSKFKVAASELAQRRVPLVIPAPDPYGRYAQTREQRAAGVRVNLRHAGIGDDHGRQVVWVTPRDPEWDAIFQYAIRKETGLSPYVAQRWSVCDGVAVRAEMRVIDTQMLLDGL
jgi:hypothetical protein